MKHIKLKHLKTPEGEVELELEGPEKINEEMETEQPGDTPNKNSDNNPSSNINENDIMNVNLSNVETEQPDSTDQTQ